MRNIQFQGSVANYILIQQLQEQAELDKKKKQEEEEVRKQKLQPHVMHTTPCVDMFQLTNLASTQQKQKTQKNALNEYWPSMAMMTV